MGAKSHHFPAVQENLAILGEFIRDKRSEDLARIMGETKAWKERKSSS